MIVDKNAVGHRIKSIRQQKGLTMKDFGKLVDNAAQSLVSRWENGLTSPNSKRLKIIATIGGISVDQLLYGNKEEYTSMLVRQEYKKLVNTHPRYQVSREIEEELIQLTIYKIINAPITKDVDYIDASYANGMLFDVFNTHYENTVFSNENAISIGTYTMIELSDKLEEYFFDWKITEDYTGVTQTLKKGLSEDLYNEMSKITSSAINAFSELRKKYPE